MFWNWNSRTVDYHVSEVSLPEGLVYRASFIPRQSCCSLNLRIHLGLSSHFQDGTNVKYSKTPTRPLVQLNILHSSVFHDPPFCPILSHSVLFYNHVCWLNHHFSRGFSSCFNHIQPQHMSPPQPCSTHRPGGWISIIVHVQGHLMEIFHSD